jgi:hypothetical protein
MAIGPSGRFDYVAEFTSTSFGSDEIVVQARSRVESGHRFYVATLRGFDSGTTWLSSSLQTRRWPQ